MRGPIFFPVVKGGYRTLPPLSRTAVKCLSIWGAEAGPHQIMTANTVRRATYACASSQDGGYGAR